MTPYLSIAAIYRNEAPYLREWIEFHKLVGVERFFLYNNESTDDHRAVLAPYVEAGIVASLTSVRASIVSGGLLTVAGTVAVAAAIPALVRYDARTPHAE